MLKRLLIVGIAAAVLGALVPAGAGADELPLGYKVRVYLTGSGDGSVTVVSGTDEHTFTSPNCKAGQPCIVTPYNGVPAMFSAAPAPGSVFKGWSGENCWGTQAYCTMMTDGSVQARFEPQPSGGGSIELPLPLTVGVNGAGAGTVTGTRISCPADCSDSFAPGSAVVLTATPGALSAFHGWSGACTGSAPTCQVNMDAAKSVTATFDVSLTVIRPLSVSVSGLGDGVVSGPGISCPGDCAESYGKDALVPLTASASPGSVFVGWSGACAGTSVTCAVTMNAAKSVAAAFAPAPGQGSSNATNPAAGGGPGTTGSTPARPPDACTIVGTRGNDMLVGTPGKDVICGLAGNDTLIGKRGADLLIGGPGRDIASGRAGNDRIVGGAGADRILGGAGSDAIYARDGIKDRVDGGPGADRARFDRAKDVLLHVESTL
jgi:Ca2+-binding RTX toxin-like protein